MSDLPPMPSDRALITTLAGKNAALEKALAAERERSAKLEADAAVLREALASAVGPCRPECHCRWCELLAQPSEAATNYTARIRRETLEEISQLFEIEAEEGQSDMTFLEFCQWMATRIRAPASKEPTDG